MNPPRSSPAGRAVRVALFGALALATLLALAASWISFRGRAEWSRVKADLLARGEKLSIVELAPPPVPDRENFFADPLWAEVFDRTPDGKPRLPPAQQQLNAVLKDRVPAGLVQRIQAAAREVVVDNLPPSHTAQQIVTAAEKESTPGARRKMADLALEALQPATGLLARIATLLERPQAQAPIAYEQGIRALVEHISPLLELGKTSAARARAYLLRGDSARAQSDVFLILRLSDSLRAEPFFISQLVRVSILSYAASAVDAGLARHAWTDAELQSFQDAFARIHPFQQLTLVLRGERANLNGALAGLRAGGESRDNIFDLMAGLSSPPSRKLVLPEQHLYLALFRAADQAAVNQSIQRLIDALSSAGGSRLPREALPDFAGSLRTRPAADLRYFFSLHSLDELRSPIGRITFVENRLLLTRLACALERAWLRHGAYPASLDDLVPEFLPHLPESAIAGQPFHYASDGRRFRLWSNGWNGTDEGGLAERKWMERGDWVWNDKF